MMQYFINTPESGAYFSLLRRNYQLGFVQQSGRPEMPDANTIARHWQNDEAVLLPGALNLQPWQSDIEQSHRLMEATLQSGEVSSLLEQLPYKHRLAAHFPLVASSFEDHDEQGIEKIYFDAEADAGGERICVAEDLWCKASWLSFIEADASLRFRFSFGMECMQDVAADPLRQQWAGRLCDAIFPESAVITHNKTIIETLKPVLGSAPAFVERIVYFNAPNGGAQMHHDVERGHDGVVYGQLSGSTFWLALCKQTLIDELIEFIGNDSNDDEIERLLPEVALRSELAGLITDRQALADYMDAFDHELVEAVMDRSPLFVRQLLEHGFGFVLHAGDVLLMPQRDLDTCVWHSVMTLGDAPGEALSFAVRRDIETQ